MGGMVDLMDGSFPGPIAPVEFQITDTERGIVKLLVGNIDLVGLQYSVVTQCCAGHRKMAFSEMKKSAKTENAGDKIVSHLYLRRDNQPSTNTQSYGLLIAVICPTCNLSVCLAHEHSNA